MNLRPATILCVDDDKYTLISLRAMLENAAFTVLEADTGAGGVSTALEEQPDLILLDVMLPHADDGFSACRSLKANPRSAGIPVVFMSSNAEPQWVADGLRAGGVDYVTKPIYPEELLMRVDHQIRIRAQEEQLTRYAAQLERMVEERTRTLLHADRLASIGTLAAGTAHEINNPTAVIRGSIDTLEMYWAKIDPALRTIVDAGKDPLLATVLAETAPTLQAMKRATERIATIVRGLLQFSSRRLSDKHPVDVAAVITDALSLVHNRLKYNIQLQHDDTRAILVWANECELVQILVNLLTNAADAIGDHPGQINISIALEGSMVVIAVEDDGPGLPSGQEKRVLEPFFTTKEKGKGTGLGLPICLTIAHNHGGTFEIVNRPEHGCRAILRIPLARDAPRADQHPAGVRPIDAVLPTPTPTSPLVPVASPQPSEVV